jgi:hypothetical protein
MITSPKIKKYKNMKNISINLGDKYSQVDSGLKGSIEKYFTSNE